VGVECGKCSDSENDIAYALLPSSLLRKRGLNACTYVVVRGLNACTYVVSMECMSCINMYIRKKVDVCVCVRAVVLQLAEKRRYGCMHNCGYGVATVSRID